MNASQAVGAALIFFGLLLASSIISLPSFSTVVVDTTPPVVSSTSFIYGSFDNPVDPYSTTLSADQSSPGLLFPSRSGDITLILTETNPDSASVSIDGTSYTMTFHSQSGDIVRYVKSWTTPTDLGRLVTFTFTAKDKAGNQVTKTVYGKTGSFDGYFEINGQKITSTDAVIYVNNRTLNVRFVATSGGSYIWNVHVTVKNTSGAFIFGFDAAGNPAYLPETTTDQVWSTSITLPSDGRYTLDGWVYMSSTINYHKMSIQIDTGIPMQLSNSQIAGFAAVLVGAALIVLGRRREA